MTTNDNQYYIYLRSTKEHIPCTKEEFDNYYRDINAYRKNQQRHGRCVCPKSRRLNCDMDCITCPFRRSGDITSLDNRIVNEEDEHTTWLDQLEAPSPLISDIVADIERMTQLFLKLNELRLQAIEIGKLCLQVLSDDAIAECIEAARSTSACTLTFIFAALAATFITSMVFSILENRKQAKRNEARKPRDIEYHEKRMDDFK